MGKNGIVAVGLCDGMSCGQIALEQLGLVVDTYYASEIDKFAIKQTQHNYPNTIQLGSIENWKQWDIDWSAVDIIFAGTPCQGFSFAGNQLAFDDPRSRLVLIFADIIRHVKTLNPNIKFFLENVKMKKQFVEIISGLLDGITPVLINSRLVSAQNRERLYWCNFSVSDIKDEEKLLIDILEENIDTKYYYSEKAISYLDRSQINKRFVNFQDTGKAHCVTANYIKGIPYNVYVDRLKSDCMTANYSNIACVNYNKSQDQIVFQNDSIRRLTPRECSRLQTVPEKYEWIVSDSQAYKMLGNGWTILVIMSLIEDAFGLSVRWQN